MINTLLCRFFGHKHYVGWLKMDFGWYSLSIFGLCIRCKNSYLRVKPEESKESNESTE